VNIIKVYTIEDFVQGKKYRKKSVTSLCINCFLGAKLKKQYLNEIKVNTLCIYQLAVSLALHFCHTFAIKATMISL